MGFDLAAAALGDLFGFGAAELGSAAAGGEIAADVGLGASELAAGTSADIGVAAAEGASAVAGDVGATGAELGGLAAEAVPAGVDIAAAGDLGTSVGADALAGAGAAPGNLALDQAQAGLGLTGGTPTAVTGASAIPAASGGLEAPTAAAAGDPNIANFLGGSVDNIDAPFSAGADPGTAASLGGGTPGATAAAAAAPAGGSSGLMSGLGTALNSPATKALELGLPLGLLGYDLIKGPGQIPAQANLAVNNAVSQAGPLQAAATQNVPLFNQTAANDLNLANNFQISPAQAASIKTWQQNQYNQLYQQIANQGNTSPYSSSEWVQGKNQIDQQALAQQTQMVTQLITTAFQASSAANAAISTSGNITAQVDATLMQAAQLQVQQDAAFQQSVSAALQAFGLVAAFSGKFSGGTAAQPAA